MKCSHEDGSERVAAAERLQERSERFRVVVEIPRLLDKHKIRRFLVKKACRCIMLPRISRKRQTLRERGDIRKRRCWEDMPHRRHAEQIKDEQPRERVLYAQSLLRRRSCCVRTW